MSAHSVSPPIGGSSTARSTEPSDGSGRHVTSLCQTSGARCFPPAGITKISGCSWSFGVSGCTSRSPNAPPERRRGGRGRGACWSRKKITFHSSSAARISAIVSGDRSSARSTPPISAPIVAVIGSTVMVTRQRTARSATAPAAAGGRAAARAREPSLRSPPWTTITVDRRSRAGDGHDHPRPAREEERALGAAARRGDRGPRRARRPTSASRASSITGAGDVFSAGFDLGEFTRAAEDPAFGAELWASSDRFHHALLTFPLPLVAAVNGPALAGGFDLAVCCDVRIAADTARFAHPEFTFGDVVYSPLHELVGGAVARDLCLTGRPIDAAEALRLAPRHRRRAARRARREGGRGHRPHRHRATRRCSCARRPRRSPAPASASARRSTSDARRCRVRRSVGPGTVRASARVPCSASRSSSRPSSTLAVTLVGAAAVDGVAGRARHQLPGAAVRRRVPGHGRRDARPRADLGGRSPRRPRSSAGSTVARHAADRRAERPAQR